jgi:hypothetical protein
MEKFGFMFKGFSTPSTVRLNSSFCANSKAGSCNLFSLENLNIARKDNLLKFDIKSDKIWRPFWHSLV